MPGLDHVGFTVSNLRRSIAFYELLLQRPPVMTRLYREPYVAELVGYPEIEMDAAFFELPGTSIILELLEYRTPPSAHVDMETYNVGNGHLCLIVDDLDAVFQRLTQAGVTFRSEKPLVSVAGPYRGAKLLYFRDPDGISVELVQKPPAGVVFESEAGSREVRPA